MVDVWVNGSRSLPNFAFRTATPFINLPAGPLLNMHIRAPGAADTIYPAIAQQGVEYLIGGEVFGPCRFFIGHQPNRFLLGMVGGQPSIEVLLIIDFYLCEGCGVDHVKETIKGEVGLRRS